MNIGFLNNHTHHSWMVWHIFPRKPLQRIYNAIQYRTYILILKFESLCLNLIRSIKGKSVSEIGSKCQWISGLTKAPHSCSSPLCWRWRGHERPGWWRLGGDVAGALSSPTLPPHHPGPDTGHGLHRQWSPVSSITALASSCSPPRTGSPPRHPTGYQCYHAQSHDTVMPT